MFPHQMLDWNLSRLEKRLEASSDDAAARAELAKAALSKAHFHGGGEVWYNRALTEARRVIQAEPDHTEALVVAGISLVALERLEAAARYLDEAMRVAADQAIVHFGTSLLLDANRDRSGAIRSMELACRISPDSWEANAALGALLHEASQAVPPDTKGAARRLVERAQFHMVRALQLEPAPGARARLLRDLGVSCLKNGRVEEALRLFQHNLDNDKYKAQAHYLLGLAMLEQGRHKNAILHLRQHLAAPPTGGRPGTHDHPNVYARIGLAYLELHEPAKAREQASLALAAEPAHVLGRFVMARAAIADGQVEEGARILRDLLEDAPDHAGAFRSVVQIRAENGDLRWLRQALRSETAVFDRLPVVARQGDHQRVAPREATRTRIDIVIAALDKLDPDAARTLLECMDLTTDEGLRFRLWESALDHCARRQAEGISVRLSEPGRYYGAALARAALQVADRLDENALVRALNLSEDDLRRAAVDRYGPVQDLGVHRQNIERERQEARAWQALMLLSVGVHRTRSGRNLLLRWATDADPDLADSARTALTLAGDTEAVAALRTRAMQRGAEGLVDQLQALLAPVPQPQRPRPVVSTPRGPVASPLSTDHAADGAIDLDAACSTCGRRSPEVEHTLVGEGAAICNHCIAAIARDRRALRSDDPTKACALCNNTVLTSRAVYVYRGVVVCADCVDDSLGLAEREVVARFLAAV